MKASAIGTLVKDSIIYVIAAIICTAIVKGTADMGGVYNVYMGMILGCIPFGFRTLRVIFVTRNPIVICLEVVLAAVIGWIAFPAAMIKDIYRVVRG